MKTTWKSILSVTILLINLVSCGQQSKLTTNSDENPTPPTNLTKNLESYNSCSDSLEGFQNMLFNALSENLEYYTECNYYEYDTVSTSSEADTNYTDTNLQETSVDEADIIKTNGEYIFVATNSGVDIFQTGSVEEFQYLSTISIENTISDLYLTEDSLIIEATGSNEEYNLSQIILYVYNINHPDSPELVVKKEIIGSLSESHLIDNTIHLSFRNYVSYSFSDYYFQASQKYSEVCYQNKGSEEDLKNNINQILEEAKTEIDNLNMDDMAPWLADTENCNFIYHNKDENTSNSLAGLYSLDLDNPEQDQTTLIQSSISDIYASTKAFYFIQRSGKESIIHKFDLDKQDSLHKYFSSGQIDGYVLNSFSLSEYENHLRVATTTGNLSRSSENNTAENHIFVLDIEKKDLPVVGQINDIALGESVYAARFIKDRGYLVTYHKVDPLFLIDLSDPENPTLTGELEMPGYSTYLHQLDDETIIGFGKDTHLDDSGDFSWYQGLKLSLYDVSNTTSPSILNEVVIGGRGSSSPALSEHHAFTFESETGLLALPVSVYEENEVDNQYGDFLYYGVHLYSLNSETGVTEKGVIETNSNVYRTIIMHHEKQNFLFVLENEALSLYDLDSLELQKSLNLSDSI